MQRTARTYATWALLVAAVSLAMLGTVIATPASAHYDHACDAYAYTPAHDREDVIAWGVGTCEDSTRHYQHQIICMDTTLYRQASDGSWRSVAGNRECRYDASHVGATASTDNYCADGSATRYAGRFFTHAKFTARNEAGQLVHTKKASSAAVRIWC